MKIRKVTRQEDEGSINKTNILSSMNVKLLHNIHVEFLTSVFF